MARESPWASSLMPASPWICSFRAAPVTLQPAVPSLWLHLSNSPSHFSVPVSQQVPKNM